MKPTRYWLIILLLGLLCNGLGLFLHSLEAEGAAITLVVLGIINVIASWILFNRSSKQSDS